MNGILEMQGFKNTFKEDLMDTVTANATESEDRNLTCSSENEASSAILIVSFKVIFHALSTFLLSLSIGVNGCHIQSWFGWGLSSSGL